MDRFLQWVQEGISLHWYPLGCENLSALHSFEVEDDLLDNWVANLVWLAIGCHFAGGCVPCRQLAWQMAEKLRALANSSSYGCLIEGPRLFTTNLWPTWSCMYKVFEWYFTMAVKFQDLIKLILRKVASLNGLKCSLIKASKATFRSRWDTLVPNDPEVISWLGRWWQPLTSVLSMLLWLPLTCSPHPF